MEKREGAERERGEKEEVSLFFHLTFIQTGWSLSQREGLFFIRRGVNEGRRQREAAPMIDSSTAER